MQNGKQKYSDLLICDRLLSIWFICTFRMDQMRKYNELLICGVLFAI